MPKAPVILALILALAPATAPASPSCEGSPPRRFARLADVPAGVRRLIGDGRMADVGQPYNATDAIRHGLPSRRFLAAEQVGCELRLRYQQGGRVYGERLAVFRHDGAAWRPADRASQPAE